MIMISWYLVVLAFRKSFSVDYFRKLRVLMKDNAESGAIRIDLKTPRSNISVFFLTRAAWTHPATLPTDLISVVRTEIRGSTELRFFNWARKCLKTEVPGTSLATRMTRKLAEKDARKKGLSSARMLARSKCWNAEISAWVSPFNNEAAKLSKTTSTLLLWRRLTFKRVPTTTFQASRRSSRASNLPMMTSSTRLLRVKNR